MEIKTAEGLLRIKTSGPLETETIGKALGALLGPGDVVGLSGDLGAGKTCFTRGIAQGIGVDPAVPVVSPSFTILNEYCGSIALYHFDFYRLEGISEDFEVEWREYFFGNAAVVVEWAEKVTEYLPDDRLDVTFVFLGDDEREIRFRGHGERYVGLIGKLVDSLIG